MKLQQILILCFLFLSSNAFAQNENQEIYKKNKVKTIIDRGIMMGFEEEQDSCDEAFTEVNVEGYVTKYKRDYKCQGWDVRFESTYEYDSLNRVIKNVNLQNDKMHTVVMNEYDENGEVMISTLQTFDPPSFRLTSRKIYYNDSAQMDSALTKVDGTDTLWYFSEYRYFKTGDLKEERVYSHPARELLSIHTFAYNKEGNMIEYNVETFIPEYSYKKSGFDYDKFGRLAKSLDLDANTSLEFFPNKNDLNIFTMHYNRFGTLEKTVKHHYTYYKK